MPEAKKVRHVFEGIVKNMFSVIPQKASLVVNHHSAYAEHYEGQLDRLILRTTSHRLLGNPSPASTEPNMAAYTARLHGCRPRTGVALPWPTPLFSSFK